MASSEYVCTLSPELLKKAKKELNEDPKTRIKKLNELREVMYKNYPDISIRNDDAFLLRFLRARKFDISRSAKLLAQYYSVRKDYPELFTDFRPSAIKHILDRSLFGKLKGNDKDGVPIFYAFFGKWEPSEIPPEEILKQNLITFEVIMMEEENQVNGIHMVGNYDGMTLGKAAAILRPTFMKKIAYLTQDALPMRLKKISYLNEGLIVDALLTITRPFLKKKTLDRIALWGTDYPKFMAEVLKPEFVPEEIPGGQGGPFDNSEWTKKVLSYEDWFLENEKYGCMGVSMTGAKKPTGELDSGTYGTIRKLNTD